LEFNKSKDKTTLDETLLTFCPPAPLLRTALNENSDAMIDLSIVWLVCWF